MAGALLSLLPAMGRGAEPEGAPIVIEKAWRGFDGVVFDEFVDFYTIQVSNPGGEMIAGEFWAEVAGVRSIRSRFHLSPGERRLLRIPDPEWRYYGRFLRFAPARVLFEVVGRHLATEELELYVAGQSVPLPLVVGSDGSKRGLDRLLIVNEDGTFPERYAGVSGEMERLVRASAAALPVDPYGYLGARGVVLSLDDFRSCSEAQWTALFEYLRLGGVVDFDGHSDPAAPARFGPWAEILPLDGTRRLRFASADLRLGGWSEGEDITIFDSVAERRSVPLHARHVGLGVLFLLPEPLGTAKSSRLPMDAWQEMLRRIPTSRFPFRVAYLDGVAPGWFARSSSIVSVAVSYLLFVALCAVVAWRSFAGRTSRPVRARRWLLAAIALAAAACPLTGLWVTSRPSPAVHGEICVVAAGSTHGVALGTLQLASTGRRRYDISVGGDHPRAHLPRRLSEVYYRYVGQPTLVERNVLGRRLPLAPAGTAAARHLLEHRVAPWSTSSFELIASIRLPGAIDGKVARRQSDLEYELDLPEWVALDDLAIVDV